MDIKEAAIQVKSLSRTFKAVMDMASVLEDIGNVEKAKEDGSKKISDINKQIQELESNLCSLNVKIEEAKERESLVVVEAQDKAKEIIKQADKVLFDAKAESDRIIEAAEKLSNKYVSDANASRRKIIEDAKKYASDVVASVGDAENRLEELGASLEEKTSEHNEIVSNIENAKASLRAFVEAQ